MTTHIPRKHFSQNFLKDDHIISRIVKLIDPKASQTLVEIGPGLGALTEKILELTPRIHAIEIDRDAILTLQEKFSESQLTIHSGNVLRFDFTTIPEPPLRIIGNLPYHISTPILFHCLKTMDLLEDLHFMLQLEVVQRLCATPGSKTYGRLSVMVQYYCEVEQLMTVPRTAFWPEPKVESAIVRLIPKTPELRVPDETLFAVIVREAFNQRRKTLRNSLKKLIPSAALSSLDIDLSKRPEQLSVKDFAKLCQNLHNLS